MILTDLVLLLLGLGCLAGIGLGIRLLIHPQSGLELTRSVREVVTPLRRPIRVERFFYRNHKGFGAFIILASAFMLFRLGALAGSGSARLGQGRGWSLFQSWFWESLIIFFTLGGLFTLGVGGVILFRPSSLKGLECWVNQDISLEKWRGGALRFRNRYTRWVVAHPRKVALFLMFGGGAVLYHFLRYWWLPSWGWSW